MLNIRYIFLIGFITLLCACNLEKEIVIELPPYESQVIVECYLEAGQFYTLLLTRSAAYFDNFPEMNENLINEILEQEATVTITYQGEVVVLENTLGINPFTNKFYNYIATKQIPEDFAQDFVLNITTKSGKTMTATTRLIEPVPIDSLVVQYNENNDTLARVLTYLSDNPDTENFYRRMLHLNTLDSLQQDFTVNDQFIDNNILVFGTGYSYQAGDTVISTILHITEDYYNFSESIANAINSNLNPFAQPSGIISNIKGEGIGIFTGLGIVRKQVILE